MQTPAFPFRNLTLAALAAWALALPAKADLNSNLRHIPAPVESLVNITTAADDWGYFLNRRPFAQMWAQMRQKVAPELENILGLSFDKDLAPMLGSNINLVGSLAELQNRGERLPFLMVFDIKDLSSFPKLLRHIREITAQDKNKLLLEYKYQGVPLYGFASVRAKEGIPFMSLSGQTLLFGSKSLVMKALECGHGKQPSALNDAHFKPALEGLRNQKFWAYANTAVLPEFVKMARGSVADENRLNLEKTRLRTALEAYDSLALGLDINRNGLLIKTVAQVKEMGLPGNKQALMQGLRQLWNDPANPMQRILQASPARPLLFASLNGLGLFNQALFSNPDTEQQQISAELSELFEKTTHLNFARDLLDYSNGQGGVSIFYPDNVPAYNRPPQAICYLGVKDNAAFLQNLQSKLQLNLSYLTEGPKAQTARLVTFPKQPSQVYNGHPLYIAQDSPTVTKLREGLFMQPAYSYVGNLWLFASSPEALRIGIDNLSGRGSNLNSNPAFNQLKSRLGLQSNAGMMYLELSSAVKLAELLAGEEEEFKALRPTMQAFHAIMAGSSFQGNVLTGTLAFDIDMDQVNFELLGKILMTRGELVGDRKPPQVRPQVRPQAPASPRPRVPGNIGL